MKHLCVILILVQSGLLAQPSQKQQEKFYRMVDDLLDHSVEEVSVSSDISLETVILDARSSEEFAVSHLKNARWVGYEDFDLNSIAEISKESKILVYCSVGYRSEKVAEQLKKAGYSRVKNLYGGLFDWANQGKEMVDSLGSSTQTVHGFNKQWGRWLIGPEVVY